MDGMRLITKNIAMDVRVIPSGVMVIIYFGRPIALVNEHGGMVWRDEQYPIFLIEHLIENPPVSAEAAKLN